MVDRSFTGEDERGDVTGSHALFSEEGVLYPFPDELFWNEGDEGEWDGDGVPLWLDVDSSS